MTEESACYRCVFAAMSRISRSRCGPYYLQLYAGGNAALIGDHILTTDVAKKRRVVLVAGVGKTLKGLLPRRMEVPVVATDDEVHLILEYGKGETVSAVAGVLCPPPHPFR